MSYNESTMLSYAFKKGYYLRIVHLPTGDEVVFPALLTSFQETYNSSWNATSVFGRMDPIYTFSNTSRTINFAISIPSADEKEASSYLDQLRVLSKFQYPNYDKTYNATTMIQSPLVRIELFNFIRSLNGRGLLGKIQTIAIEPEVESGFFDENTKLIPKVLTLNINFDVLHEEQPWSEPVLVIGEPYFNAQEELSTPVDEAVATDPVVLTNELNAIVNNTETQAGFQAVMAAAKTLGGQN